ncbi:aldehyde dehydrogenase family protein [uncultured Friedmanniella sp.]|uniref:aldehyde dehydrogenase family protein n=1 Tax=uncultured Friedmanniella sp. TaxID=335381 RepID=UPI0035CAFE7B
MADYAVTNPATGETVREYPTATEAEIEAALSAASLAARTWGRTSTVPDRAALVRRVGELHTERRDELAAIIVREMGKPTEDALGEIDFAAAIYGYYADHAEEFSADEPIDLLDGEGSALIRRSPYGALLGIMPWNFPYYQVARFAGPNLAIGNTIVLKHAPQCPESAAAMQQIFTDAGFPDGAYVNVYATNDQVATIIADPRIAGVSLTGSERAGAAVAELAGRNLKKVVLELGGSDPFVLLSTDDLDATVEAAAGARLDNTGQTCNAAKRFIVADDLYEPFVERFTAALLQAGDGIAPLSSNAAADRLQDQVDRAVAAGASITTAGERSGAYFPPAVLTGVLPEHEAFREEFFGPVAMVFPAATEDAAVALANDTPYGLGSYVFTTDPEQAARVADGIDAGMVFVNGVMLDSAELPFGGTKRSGFGRELGRFGMDEFVNKKLIRNVTPLPSPVSAGPLDEARVLAAADRLVAAFAATDTARYFDCFAPDASFVIYSEGERFADRAAYEQAWAGWLADGWRVLTCTSTERLVQVYGSTAIFTHRVQTVTTTGDVETATDERETIIFALQDGRLVAVHDHLSAVPA